MKQFSIHKVNKPAMKRGADEDVGDGSFKQTGNGDFNAGEITGAMSGVGKHESRIGDEQPSLLSAEEQEALQPKEIKVVNPWIHEATHKEYLESVKVSPYQLVASPCAPI